MDIRPFTIAIADDTLEDLRSRLDATRWPQTLDDPECKLGIDNRTVREWCERWVAFDWPAYQDRLNQFDNFVAIIDGLEHHFIHVRSTVEDATPLLLMNGWPSSFVELAKLVEPLTTGTPAFHVVIPSLSGFGFSAQPGEPGWNLTRMAKAMAELMTELGYERFGAHGSDMGAGVMLALADQVPDRLIAMHSVNVYWAYPKPDDLTPEEQKWYKEGEAWQPAEGGYAMIQASKPQTLAVALNDSPAGLAAWILEKWQGWSDRGLDGYEPDDVLANLTIYWATGTIGSSIRLYAEAMQDPDAKKIAQRFETPTGVLILPGDILPAPRAWGERWLNIVRWTEAKSGGHFPAVDSRDLLVEEIRATFAASVDAKRAAVGDLADA